jgi:hypothetical protein
LQDAPQLQLGLQQDNDTVSTISDKSDDPLLLHPHGNICAMLAHAGNINATPQSYGEARHSSKWEQWEFPMKEELAKWRQSLKTGKIRSNLPDMSVISQRQPF